MGDHRSNSGDSRAHDGPRTRERGVGPDRATIVGRAVLIVWPLDHLTWLSVPDRVLRHVPAPSADSTTEPQGTGGTDGDRRRRGGRHRPHPDRVGLSHGPARAQPQAQAAGRARAAA